MWMIYVKRHISHSLSEYLTLRSLLSTVSGWLAQSNILTLKIGNTVCDFMT